ncbi:MAG: TlpA family protein disulfide reductase [Sphingobacterium sp.]|nr:TlpA family protein disulfide reductase [Sphingobacterium sp.]
MKLTLIFSVILHLISLTVNAQGDVPNKYQDKKLELKITIDSTINIRDLFINIDDGTKPHVLKDSLAKRSFGFSSPYFAPYASLSISTNLGQEFEYFLDDRTATINILPATDSANGIRVLHSSTMTDLMDSTQNPLREVFSEFRKNDVDNLALFDLFTKHQKELRSNDSLQNLSGELLRSFNKKLFDLYAQYPNDYYTFFCFRRDMDFTISTIKTDERYFSDLLAFYNRTFPKKYRNTAEGKKLETGILSQLTSTKEGDSLDIVFTDIDGIEHRSKNFETEYVLLDFWATWCGPCMAQIPHIRALHEKFSNVQVIGISADQDSSKMKNAIAGNQMKWTHVWDENRLLATQLNVLAYPSLILIDRSGKIVYRRTGSGNDDKLLKILETK